MKLKTGDAGEILTIFSLSFNKRNKMCDVLLKMAVITIKHVVS